jgi:hypothetical protein
MEQWNNVKDPPTPNLVRQLKSPALVPYTDPRKAITVQRTRPIKRTRNLQAEVISVRS